jgi:hypothetical protein
MNKQLKKGIRVEAEHTKGKLFTQKKSSKTRKELQTKIAKDHIKEDPRYYDHLQAMERKAKKQRGKKR